MAASSGRAFAATRAGAYSRPPSRAARRLLPVAGKNDRARRPPFAGDSAIRRHHRAGKRGAKREKPRDRSRGKIRLHPRATSRWRAAH
nr:hypothetical protein [Burkholderia thailandensis]